MRVYVAGPYTKGDQVVNVRNAIQAAETLVMWRHTPFIPHLSHLWHTVVPHPWEFWLEQDIAWLAVCEALVRLPGESLGADKEVDEAIARGIPVYHSLGAFREATRVQIQSAICEALDMRAPLPDEKAAAYALMERLSNPVSPTAVPTHRADD